MTMTNQTATAVQLIATADVCKTPPFSVPVPYPNIAGVATTICSFTKLLITGGHAVTTGDRSMISTGDEAGAMGGVASGSIMGPARVLSGSTAVFAGGFPLTTLEKPTSQNTNNGVGFVGGSTQNIHFVLR